MVEIDLSSLEISEEEIKKKLRSYFKRGYRWKAYFEDSYTLDDPDFRIYTPKYIIDSQDVIDYFHNLKELKIGDNKLLEMNECLGLIRLLSTAQYKYLFNQSGDRLSYFLDSNIFKK